MQRPTLGAAAAALLGCLMLACRQSERPPAVAAAAPRAAPAPEFRPVTDEALVAATAAGADWLSYGGAYNNQRFSRLDQITRANVSQLVPVWVFQTGIAESFETTPLVVGNIMYLTAAGSRVMALNAATGEKLWEYTPQLGTTFLCCGPNNRGVAAYQDKVYVATLDARLIALDHRTGQVVWEAQVADSREGYSLTMAPLAYAGRVVVGISGGEFGIRGFVTAYDAASGELAWRWYTVPAPSDAPNGWWGEWRDTDPFGTPLHRDIPQEKKNSSRYPNAWRRGGGPVYMTPAYDPAKGTLFLGVGNPSPDLDGRVRPGDNLYTSSLVALDAMTGQLRWYFQYLPHNVWDLEAASPPFLFELDGQAYVGHAGKTGWLYVVRADSGAPVLRSDNFVPQENLFAAPTPEGVRMAPGANGGSGWSPVAYSPRTGFAYVLGLHQPMIYSAGAAPWQKGRLWLGGSFRLDPESEQFGTFSAIDVRTGEIRWQRRVPVPMLGAALATAGDVVFVGQGSGTFDAFDAETGELLWQFRTGSGVHGGPVSYLVDGVQYVAVAAGGNFQLDTPRGDDLFVFALPDRRPLYRSGGYDEGRYTRAGPIRHGAIRQVPAGGAGPAARGAEAESGG